MSDVILIGALGETWPYEAAGLTCFEPEPERLAERVQAERVRCEVLAMTRAAFDRLPAGLGRTLRESVWPELAIVPAVHDLRGATSVVDGLQRTVASHGFHYAA